MRRRGFRVFVIIAIIVALSVATLGFRDIHIAGLDRANQGPLGLKLGLDLQGGSHLVYQADLPDEVSVTFLEALEEQQLRETLTGLDQPTATIAKTQFTINDLSLEIVAISELTEALEVLFPVGEFSTGDGVLNVSFRDSPDEASVRSVLDELQYTDVTIYSQGENQHTIRGLPPLVGTDVARLGDALEGLAPLVAFTTGDGIVEVTFRDTPDQAAMRFTLDELGYVDAVIGSSGEYSYTIEELALAEQALLQLRNAMEDKLSSVVDFVTGDGVLDVTFVDALENDDLRTMLDESGYTEAVIQVPAQRQYIIRQLVLDEAAQVDVRTALERLSPIETESFVITVDDPSSDQMKGVVNKIQRRVNALGTAEPIIQTLGSDRVVVQLPGVGGSSIDVGFQNVPALLAEVAFVLERRGHTAATVEQTGAATFVFRSPKELTQDDREALGDLAETLGPDVDFNISTGDETEVVVTVPPQPDRLSLVSVMSELGHTDFDIKERDASSFVIRTDEALTTEEQDSLREDLEGQTANLVAFEVSGGIEEAKRLIGETAQLVFKERTCLMTLDELNFAPGRCDPVESGGSGREGRDFVDRDIGLRGEDLNRAFRSRDPTTDQPVVQLEFNGRGADIIDEITREIVGNELRRLAVFLDDQQLTAPVVRGVIPDGRPQIIGGFTNETAGTLAIQLESGTLDVPLTLIRETTVDALLGSDSLRKSLIAGLVGLGLVLLFMVVYYRMAGVVAAFALIVYAVIVLAIIKLVPITLTLSGIAGLVLSVGLAVDANILIFERMKEEMRTGRTLTSAMEVGFRRAWSAIRDGNVSTMITCAILFLFGSRLGGGTPVITGLAVTLLIGVAVSMFTAIMVSRNMLQILALTPAGKRMALFTPEPRRQPAGVASGGR